MGRTMGFAGRGQQHLPPPLPNSMRIYDSISSFGLHKSNHSTLKTRDIKSREGGGASCIELIRKMVRLVFQPVLSGTVHEAARAGTL